MRISDCSSDVCSSDLTTDQLAVEAAGPAFQGIVKAPEPKPCPTSRRMPAFEPLHEAPEDRPPTAARAGPAVFHKNRSVNIGRASCRERVCKYESLADVSVEIQKKRQKKIKRYK